MGWSVAVLLLPQSAASSFAVCRLSFTMYRLSSNVYRRCRRRRRRCRRRRRRRGHRHRGFVMFSAPPEVLLQPRCVCTGICYGVFAPLEVWPRCLNRRPKCVPHPSMHHSVFCTRSAASVRSFVSNHFLPAAGLTVGLVFAATAAAFYGVYGACVCDLYYVSLYAHV